MEEQLQQNEWHHVVTVEDLGGLHRRIDVIYDTIGVQMALDKAKAYIGKQVQIKGFRKGKAPLQLVEAGYMKDMIKLAEEWLSKEGFLHACFEQKMVALKEPKFENASIGLNGSFSCEIFVEVKPTITPTGYIGLQLTKQVPNIDALADAALENMKYQHMTENQVEVVADNTNIVIDYKVLSNGTEVSAAQDQTFVVRAGQQPPFGANLFGMKAGEVVSVLVEAPAGELKGQELIVDISLKKVFEKVLPTEAELVERSLAPSYAELINALRQKAEQDAANNSRKIYEEEIVDKLIELHQFDVPQDWVDEEEKYFAKQLNIEKPDDSIKQYLHTMAERNVRRSFLLESIYEAEPSLKLTQEEFEAFLTQEAAAQNIGRPQLEEMLKKNNMLDGVLGLLKHRKVMDIIINQAIFADEVNQEKGELDG